MSEGLSINAVDLNDLQVGLWLEDMAKTARGIISGGVLGSTQSRLHSLAGDLRGTLSHASRKIIYLGSVKTVRPEGLTTAIQEDLLRLCEVERAVRVFLSSIELFGVPPFQSSFPLVSFYVSP
ncbi:hypothetical protein J1780_03505 [Rahnella aceris]|uniref:hypothetical protein n=1 Tax=Rahnella sp. (strain Y9602) TaxID=2703885 RepID=UPI001C27535F|nr:hypothetical protein [Rahnella aceris]MBU9839028.1 hypothetical protein [Rahnella aceris]